MAGGNGKPYENQVGLSAEKLVLLEELLKRLENYGSELYHATLRYLLDDGPDSVLASWRCKMKSLRPCN